MSLVGISQEKDIVIYTKNAFILIQIYVHLYVTIKAINIFFRNKKLSKPIHENEGKAICIIQCIWDTIVMASTAPDDEWHSWHLC